jgi:hypothetical protein
MEEIVWPIGGGEERRVMRTESPLYGGSMWGDFFSSPTNRDNLALGALRVGADVRAGES